MSAPIMPTTLVLPADLVARIDRIVQEGQADSRDSFVEMALRRELATLEAAEINVVFASMADDTEYHADVRRLSEEFATADSEIARMPVEDQ